MNIEGEKKMPLKQLPITTIHITYDLYVLPWMLILMAECFLWCYCYETNNFTFVPLNRMNEYFIKVVMRHQEFSCDCASSLLHFLVILINFCLKKFCSWLAV